MYMNGLKIARNEFFKSLSNSESAVGSGLSRHTTYRNSGRQCAIPGNRAVIHAIDTL